MKSQEEVVQDYYGANYFLEKNKDNDITIFIVDDNQVYLKLLKDSLTRKNFSILTFSTGEECLDYLDSKPDLIILDYHLDGVNPYAMKGDKIQELIREKLPEVEIVLMSADKKFEFISDINFSKKVLFKDDEFLEKVEENVSSVIDHTKEEKQTKSKTSIYITAIVILVAVVSVMFYYLIN